MTTFATMFSGGEGVGVGLRAAGLTHVWGVEYDADIAAVAADNGFPLIVDDVRRVDYSALPRVDWLHASPVCTRASVANSGATESAEDIETADAVVRALKAQEPRIFTLENVWGYRDFAAFRLILNALGEGGYFYDFEHVNAADFGVPQTRRRLVLRASRGLLPMLPEPVPWVGWYAAIEDLLPTLPESKLAPWQLARLPEELRASVLFSSNGNSESFGDHHAEQNDPALSVTAQGLGRARAVLVDMHNAVMEATTRGADEPSSTQGASMGSRPSHQLAVLIDTANASRDATALGVTDPAMTMQAWHGRRPSQAPLAVLVAGLLNSESTTLTTRGGVEPSFTVTTSHNQRDARACPGARVVSMTARCLARFQSVPDAYRLPDKRTLAARVVGNMVPPLLMQRIAEGFEA